ncbi:DUF6339 family protein [Enterococcus faecalis]
MYKICYVTDVFLDEFKTNFDSSYLKYYKNNDKDKIVEIFSNPDNTIESSIDFAYKPLFLESEHPNCIYDNIRIIWESLRHLTPSEAENEKLWVALENIYYLDYHLDQLDLIKGKNRDSSIKSRTIFNRGKKRSLVINNISLLWWIAYYMYDDSNEENPYYFSDFYVSGGYRGNSVAFLSSNIISNKDIMLGVLEAVKELSDNNKMQVNRYSYTNSNKILNQIGGVKILDCLTRQEIKKIILDNLLDTEKINIL